MIGMCRLRRHAMKFERAAPERRHAHGIMTVLRILYHTPKHNKTSVFPKFGFSGMRLKVKTRLRAIRRVFGRDIVVYEGECALFLLRVYHTAHLRTQYEDKMNNL